MLRYIEEHLDDDLDVETLSGIAAFSKHHFHRQFSALFGIGACKYVQLLRLKRASYRLAFHDDRSILAIALESGYEGPEAFARAFKQQLGQTPSEFRRQPNWGTWHAAYETIGETRTRHMKNDLRNADVKIVDVSDTRVAALEHRGDPALIEESVRRFIAWRREAKLPPKISGTFNVWYNSPLDTPPDEFRFDLCAATEKEIAPNVAGIVAKTIPGGRCAMLRHIGTEDSLGEAVSYLYADWLPRSGEEPRDFPLYFQRISFFPDVAEHEAITDIFLPLK